MTRDRDRRADDLHRVCSVTRCCRREFPLLCRAAAETGGVATQNRGTIGGNIANASPAADTPPALLVYDAELELVSSRGTRRVPYQMLPHGLQADGSRRRRADRAGIRLPNAPGAGASTERSGRAARRPFPRSVWPVACDITVDGVVDDVRIALGSVSPTVVRARAAEAALRGHGLTDATITAAEAELEREIAPIDDIRSTAGYRLRVARALLREALRL